jgi:hypothetical protein
MLVLFVITSEPLHDVEQLDAIEDATEIRGGANVPTVAVVVVVQPTP